MKRLLFWGTMICAVLILAVVGYGYPNPAASIPQDNTSVSVSPTVSPPEMGTLTANTAMFSGTAPPVIANTDTPATTIAANSLTSAITNSPPTTQYSDITAITMTISGFERAGPMTSTLSNGLVNATTMLSNPTATNMEGAMGISPPIVVNDYPNPYNATVTNNAAPTKEVRFNYIGNLRTGG